MSKAIGLLSTLVLCSALSNPAAAALVGTADGAIDTNTGLNWLNISQTLNLSYSQVSAEFGAGGLFAGYRFATFDEVVQLYSDVGVGHISQSIDGSNNRHAGSTYGPLDLSVFFNLVGTTSTTAPTGIPGSCSNEVARGNIANGNSTISHTYCVNINPPYGTWVDEINVGVTEGTLLNASATSGSWLVSEVPIPASGLLMLPALLGLFGVRKQQRRRAS